MSSSNKIVEVALVFFKLGCFAFGGPAAHVAMMEDEIVRKRKWMSEQHFLDLMGATNLIPGPNSTEMTMHCGHERAGIAGLFVAGICFIFPAVVLTGVLAWLYTEYGQLPNVAPFFEGIKPAVLALIAGAIFKLGKKALKNWILGILGIIALILCLSGINEIIVLLGTGVLGMLYFTGKSTFQNPMLLIPLNLVSFQELFKMPERTVFLTFLKVGSVLYGSGYVLFAYLDAELVETGWLTRQQLIDAIAAGQFTPGPVLSTATFIGFQLQGWSGALLATLGIFLPSFLFVWILNPLIPKMQQSTILRGFLDGVNIAAVAVMIAVLCVMTQTTLINWKMILIAVLGCVVTFGLKKPNPILTVIGGSLMGWILSLI